MRREAIIGLDLGNFFAQPIYIEGLDPVRRTGGVVYDLVDLSSSTPYGIPSAFFYSKKRGILIGAEAARAVPKANCVRYLKRDLFKNGKPNSKTIDGKEFTYQEMILAVAQYAIRSAAQQLDRTLHIKTNMVALAYPASMSSFVKNYLVSIIEQVTLEDGTNVEIYGTIAEPAAAALDYLAVSNITNDDTALVADLGAGTFDVSIVKAYPNGRQHSDGSTYYYDVKFTDGIEDLGGKEFDEIVKKILIRKAGAFGNDPRILSSIESCAESTKRELTTSKRFQPDIILNDGSYIDEITLEEFEQESAEELERILKMVEQTINTNTDITIDHIILTGGASQMPMIERSFKERFPQYADKIAFHMPSKAIASGAARFAVRESNPVVLRTIRDIGSDFYVDANDKKGFIRTYVPAGTQIPVTSEWMPGYKLTASDKTHFGIYEAKISSPDTNNIARDYQYVHDHNHRHGQERPVGYKTLSRIVIDEKHLAYLEVQEPDNPSMGIVRYPFTIDFE